MEQHSGNLCFSLEALGYFFQTLRVGYANCSLQSIAVGLLRVAEAGTGAASRRQQQRGISTSPKLEHLKKHIKSCNRVGSFSMCEKSDRSLVKESSSPKQQELSQFASPALVKPNFRHLCCPGSDDLRSHGQTPAISRLDQKLSSPRDSNKYLQSTALADHPSSLDSLLEAFLDG